MPKSPEADSEKTGGVGGVNLEARPAESGAHHNSETNDRDPQAPVIAAAASSSAPEKERAQTKVVEDDDVTAVDPNGPSSNT